MVEAVAKHLSGSKRQRLEGTPADAMQHDGEVLPEAEGAGEAQGPEGAVGATQVDPACIRLTAHNSYLDQPKPAAFKYRGVDRLSEMLQHYKDVSPSPPGRSPSLANWQRYWGARCDVHPEAHAVGHCAQQAFWTEFA